MYLSQAYTTIHQEQFLVLRMTCFYGCALKLIFHQIQSRTQIQTEVSCFQGSKSFQFSFKIFQQHKCEACWRKQYSRLQQPNPMCKNCLQCCKAGELQIINYICATRSLFITAFPQEAMKAGYTTILMLIQDSPDYFWIPVTVFWSLAVICFLGKPELENFPIQI